MHDERTKRDATTATDAATQHSRADVESVVRARLRSLRVARGWSLDDVAERTHLGVSTLSRIETGKRTIGIDVLLPLCAALQVDIADLLDMSNDADVIIRPEATEEGTRTVWMLNRPDSDSNVIASKWRLEDIGRAPELRVHPGHDWFYVLSGAIRLGLGDRVLQVAVGEAAEFSTMIPHSITAQGGPAEILTIFDRTGHHAHTADA